jgi:hypothetical protein
MVKEGWEPNNPTRAFDYFVARGYGSVRKGDMPVRQRPSPPAPMMSNSTHIEESEGGKKPPSRPK